jgi:hypothetical protein
MNDHAVGTIGTFDRGIRHLTWLDHALLHPGRVEHRFSVGVVLDHLLKGLMIDHRGLSLCLAAVAVALVVPKVVPKDHFLPLVLNRDDRAWQ